jgi:glutathione S-transferase
MRVKQVEFEVTYVNLREKPDWFLEISPHGKVPVLKVDDEILFESNAIAEFLDEQVAPPLHPADPFKRARNRAWTDFVPDFSKAINGIGYAKTAEAVAEGLEKAQKPLSRLERALATERGNDGPYFNGDKLCLVDAAYGPILQRFAKVEQVLETGLLKEFPLVQAWSDALLANETVIGAVPDNFPEEFEGNHKRRETYYWSRRLASQEAAE